MQKTDELRGAGLRAVFEGAHRRLPTEADITTEVAASVCAMCDRPVADRPISEHACEYFRD
jgi:hypothetical protein